MKRLAVLFCLFLVTNCRSASVLWNEGLSISGEVNSSENTGSWFVLLQHDTPYGLMWNDFTIVVEQYGIPIRRRLYGDEIDLGREAWFIVAEDGDEINAETTKDASRLFITNSGTLKFEDSVKPEYLFNKPWTLYLGFESAIYSEYEPYERKVYGWMELFVENYTITLGNSCIDLTGRPVVVGVRSAEPIPEPASGALALLGAALLFRRRARLAR